VLRGFRAAGFDVVKRDPLPASIRRRALLARKQGVTVVLEVGSNRGVFIERLRAAGYRGRVVSFEPQQEAFEQLSATAAADPDWECLRTALGSSPGSATLNVAGNSLSSSLLAMEERHATAAPQSGYVGTETCSVATLDSLRDTVLRSGDRAYLKLDVQGFELEALRGAEASMEQVVAVDAELSFVPLYEGAPTIDEIVRLLDERGFGLTAIDPVFVEKSTGTILQVMGLFARIRPTS